MRGDACPSFFPSRAPGPRPRVTRTVQRAMKLKLGACLLLALTSTVTPLPAQAPRDSSPAPQSAHVRAGAAHPGRRLSKLVKFRLRRLVRQELRARALERYDLDRSGRLEAGERAALRAELRRHRREHRQDRRR